MRSLRNKNFLIRRVQKESQSVRKRKENCWRITWKILQICSEKFSPGEGKTFSASSMISAWINPYNEKVCTLKLFILFCGFLEKLKFSRWLYENIYARIIHKQTCNSWWASSDRSAQASITSSNDSEKLFLQRRQQFSICVFHLFRCPHFLHIVVAKLLLIFIFFRRASISSVKNQARASPSEAFNLIELPSGGQQKNQARNKEKNNFLALETIRARFISISRSTFITWSIQRQVADQIDQNLCTIWKQKISGSGFSACVKTVEFSPHRRRPLTNTPAPRPNNIFLHPLRLWVSFFSPFYSKKKLTVFGAMRKKRNLYIFPIAAVLVRTVKRIPAQLACNFAWKLFRSKWWKVNKCEN